MASCVRPFDDEDSMCGNPGFHEVVPLVDETTGSGPQLPGLNKRCRNRKLREQLQVELVYPTILEGLPQALSADQ